MGYGIGLPPDSQGTGTQPEDMQRWIWSLYRAETPGIVRGLNVTTRSNMFYDVSAGVAVFPNGAQRAIAVPFSAAQVPTLPAPSSGSRTDYIYATKSSAIQVGTSQPPGTALIGKRTVPAGITATTATVDLLGDRKYAPLFGSSMGLITYWRDSVASGSKVTPGRYKKASVTFTLESDRRLQLMLQVTYEMLRKANVGNDIGREASFIWEYWVDGQHLRSMEMGVKDYPETKFADVTNDFTAGTHTIDIYRTQHLLGTSDPENDYPVTRSGGPSSYPGTFFKVVDLGGIE